MGGVEGGRGISGKKNIVLIFLNEDNIFITYIVYI